MSTTKKSTAKEQDRGKFPKKHVRPSAFDLAALDVLTVKLQTSEAGVWRMGLARLVDFEGVRQQVEEREAQYNVA